MTNKEKKVIARKIGDYITRKMVIDLMRKKQPFLESMKEIMQIGKEISDEIGHKDYPSVEEFFKDIESGTSPIFELDGSWKVIGRIGNVMLLGITSCPVKSVMIDLLENPQDDDVSIYLKDIHLLEGEIFNSITIGSYALLQIRQMVASSLTINGVYCINLINLVIQKPEITESGVETKFILAEKVIKNLARNSDFTVVQIKERINELITEHQHDLCILAIMVENENKRENNQR